MSENNNTVKPASRRLVSPEGPNDTYDTARFVQPYNLFFMLNREMPSKINFLNIDKSELLKSLYEKYELTENDLILSKTWDFDGNKYEYQSVIIPIKKNLHVFFNPGTHDSPATEVLYTPDIAESELKELEELIKKFYTKTSHMGKIHLLQLEEFGGYDINSFAIKKQEIDIKKQYNDDFEEVSEVIIKRLNTENDKGLVLLHGKAGTGKTSYIRYLTSQVNKKMIFLSPDMMHKISSPDFVGILANYPNTVIILEDAENVIEERKGGGDSAMSNLLNLTDGLLADCLKIQLICSFNTDVSHIDKALLRKGRLIAKYEFKELEQKKAQALSDSIGFKTKIEAPTILAELFNQDEKNYSSDNSQKIGFKVSSKK